MGYYDDKKKMNEIIDKIIEKNEETEINNIYFLINNMFGYGKQIIDKRLNILEEFGIIKIEEGIITKNDKANNNNDK